MVSTGYRLGDYTPYVGYSKLEDEGVDSENHSTFFTGVRYDFHSYAALKVQFDQVKDNYYDVAVDGDSKSLTVSVDFVF